MSDKEPKLEIDQILDPSNFSAQVMAKFDAQLERLIFLPQDVARLEEKFLAFEKKREKALSKIRLFGIEAELPATPMFRKNKDLTADFTVDLDRDLSWGLHEMQPICVAVAADVACRYFQERRDNLEHPSSAREIENERARLWARIARRARDEKWEQS